MTEAFAAQLFIELPYIMRLDPPERFKRLAAFVGNVVHAAAECRRMRLEPSNN